MRKYPLKLTEQKTNRSVKGEGQLHDAPVQEMVVAEDIDYDRMPHKRTPYNLPPAGGGSVSYFDSIYADTLLPPRAVSVYMYLKDRSNSAGSCWPGIKTIARDMNLSRSTVKRALADLEQHGYLAKLPRYRPNGSNTSNLYTLK